MSSWIAPGFRLALAAALALQVAMPVEAVEPDAIRVLLVGDSTTATRNGYGDALCECFRSNVTCINLAKNGRSSGSFRAEGLWAQVMGLLRARGQFHATYVLIQFGHNDQPGKPGRSTDLATEFPANIARYVDEVKSGGGVPVLVTPLTRRIFRNGNLQNDLRPWAEATRSVAKTKQTPLIDLNAVSAAAVTAMGPAEADTLAEAPPPVSAARVINPADTAAIAKTEPNGGAQGKFDYTHLGAKGAALFSGMVARELGRAVPELALHIRAEKPAT